MQLNPLIEVLGFMRNAVLALCVLCASTLVFGEDKMVQLELVLPKPVFLGTPKDLKTANLEKPRDQRNKIFLTVPEGTKNVALNKPVTSSDPQPFIGTLPQITDGIKDAADGNYVELWKGLQWIQIDLEAKFKIHAIALWHYHSEARIYHDVVVQTADDADFITGVKTLFNNDHDNSAGLGIGKDGAYIETFEGKQIELKDITGRYVRFYTKGSTSSDLNHYTEIEIYGEPAK